MVTAPCICQTCLPEGLYLALFWF